MPRLPNWFFRKSRIRRNINRAVSASSRREELEDYLTRFEPGPGMKQMLREQIDELKRSEAEHLGRALRLHPKSSRKK